MLAAAEGAREVKSGHSMVMRAVSVAVLCAFVLAGCNRTYIYSSARMPKISEGALQVRAFERSHAPVNSYAIERIGVRHLSNPNFLRAPTDQELSDLMEGRPLDAHIIEIDVDASTAHWRDYGLSGAGVGLSLAMLSGLAIEDNIGFVGPQAQVLLLSILLGGSGFLTGLIAGTLTAPDAVDMRYPQGYESP